MSRRRRVEVMNDQNMTSVIHLESRFSNRTLCDVDLQELLARSTTDTVTCMTCLVREARQ